MASAWDVDWALAITSWDHRELLSEEGRTGTFVGWVTSLSRRRGRVPPLPAPVRIEQVEDKGRCVGELLSRVGLMQSVIP
jgi:hypothetical protein